MARKKQLSEGEQLVQRVNNLFEIARTGIQPEHSRWRDNYKYWNNSQVVKRPKEKDKPKIPYIFMLCDGIQAVLTANKPKFSFHPQEGGDTQKADFLNQICGDYYWDELEMQQMSEEALWWALNISGSAIVEYGKHPVSGSMYFNVVNSFYVYPDPGAVRLKYPDGRPALEFLGTECPMSLSEIRRIWPEEGKRVAPTDNLMVPDRELETQVTFYGRSSYKAENLIGAWKNDMIKKSYGRALVRKMWLNETDMVNIPFDEDEIDLEIARVIQGEAELEAKPEENHPKHIEGHRSQIVRFAANPDIESEIIEALERHIEDHAEYPQETKKLKYPDGRLVYTAGDILLDDMPAPLGLNYVKLDILPNPMTFWGQTLQTYVQSLQDAANKRLYQASDINDRAAGPREFYNPLSGYDPNKAKGLSAERIPVKGDVRAAVYIDPGIGPNQAIFAELKILEELILKIVGWSEVMQGVYPKGSPSGISLQQLREALGVRLYKGVGHFEYFIIKLAKVLLKMLKYENPKKAFRVIAEDKRQEMYVTLLEIMSDETDYDVRILGGSTLPTSRMDKEERAIKLRQAGLYDDQAALESIDDPAAQEVLERKNEKEQLLQVIQMLSENLKQYEGSNAENENVSGSLSAAERRKTNSY